MTFTPALWGSWISFALDKKHIFWIVRWYIEWIFVYIKIFAFKDCIWSIYTWNHTSGICISQLGNETVGNGWNTDEMGTEDTPVLDTWWWVHGIQYANFSAFASIWEFLYFKKVRFLIYCGQQFPLHSVCMKCSISFSSLTGKNHVIVQQISCSTQKDRCNYIRRIIKPHTCAYCHPFF